MGFSATQATSVRSPHLPDVLITGHSLGGGVAALLAALWRAPQRKCFSPIFIIKESPAFSEPRVCVCADDCRCPIKTYHAFVPESTTCEGCLRKSGCQHTFSTYITTIIIVIITIIMTMTTIASRSTSPVYIIVIIMAIAITTTHHHRHHHHHHHHYIYPVGWLQCPLVSAGIHNWGLSFDIMKLRLLWKGNCVVCCCIGWSCMFGVA